MSRAAALRLRGRRRWSQLSQVERVELYTRQSLYVLLVVADVYVLTVAAAAPPHFAAVVIGGGVATTLAGMGFVRSALDRDAAVDPVPARHVAALLAVAVAYLAAVALGTADGRSGAAFTIVIVLSLSLGLLRSNATSAALIGGSAAVAAILDPSSDTVSAALIGAVACVATSRISLWLLGIVRDLDAARHAQSELAVMEERLRFSRDVHDVLGRRLSTIAVQADLAAALARRGDDRAPVQMLEVRGVAHLALREARELARGYRSTNFAQELDGARSLLRSAGIEARLNVEEMPKAWHEAAGWVVRECVTNVLRHSDAATVDIEYAGSRLLIDNDGALTDAPATGSLDGSGLASLRERLIPLGASLYAGPSDGGRWSVVVELPGAGPLTAVTSAGAAA